MKNLLAKEQRKRTMANIITGCSVVLFAILLYRIDGVFAFLSGLVRVLFPFTIGFVVAFLLDPPIYTLERGLKKMCKYLLKRRSPPDRLYRIIAAMLMYSVLIGLIIGVLGILLPQVVDSIRNLIYTVSRDMNRNRDQIEQFLREFDMTTTGNSSLLDSLITAWDDFAARSLSYTGQLVVGIVNVSASVGGILSEFFIGLIISLYMIFGKEKFAAQAKKLGCALMPVYRVHTLTHWFRKTHKVFSRYIVGQLLTSLVIGVLCYIVMLILKIDYALLISVVVAVTNIVPFFGPIVGAVAGFVILLIVKLPDPTDAIKFAASVVILQQLEGNLIAPRILGNSIGISSFWIMLSIIVGGGLFGLPGILLGIPVFAVAYSIVQTVVAEKLTREGLPPETAAYYSVDSLPERPDPPAPDETSDSEAEQ